MTRSSLGVTIFAAETTAVAETTYATSIADASILEGEAMLTRPDQLRMAGVTIAMFAALLQQ